MASLLLDLIQEEPRAESLIQARKVHLVGACGSGMRALADVLEQSGCTLSGSDEALDSPICESGRWYAGHTSLQVEYDCELVVHSAAIDFRNVELQRARKLGIPTISYPQLLGRLMAGQFGVAVAGTHGKSTTTAMTAAILREAGFSPTVFCGATPLGKTSGGRAGESHLLVAEACEYRNHFHALRPQVAAVLGVEPDHFDFFHSAAQLEASFAQFLQQVEPDGVAICSASCPTTVRIAAAALCRVEFFGTDGSADWHARNVSQRRGLYRFDLWYRGTPLGQVRLTVPGLHNLHNALAAAALAYHSGADGADVCRGLEHFNGLERRLQTIYDGAAGTIIDDYAHHPTEVSAALATIRQQIGRRRLWCVFQPHQASRTARLLDTLAASLQNADEIIVADIFRAREPRPAVGEVTAADLADEVRRLSGNVPPAHSNADILAHLAGRWRVGDVLVTMGAGDIGKIAHEFDQWIRKNRSLR